jgi:starch phosphorylase
MFNTHRMVTEYWTRFYQPSAERRFKLIKNDWEHLKSIAKWSEKIMLNWSSIAIKEIRMDNRNEVDMGASFSTEADIYLGEFTPEDVLVEAYYGKLDPSDQFLDSFTKIMEPTGNIGENIHRFHCDINFEEVGHFGINIRLTPNHPNPESRHAMGLVIWGEA